MAENAPVAGSSHSSTTNAPPPPSGGGSGVVWIVLVLAVIGAVIAVMLVRGAKKPPARTPPLLVIAVTNAVRGDIDETISRMATVTAIYTAWISPRVDGQLIRVDFKEGEIVKTNDLLAEIDPAPYQAQLTSFQGQLARDKAQLEGAQIDLGRYQEAYQKKAIPKQQVDDQLALVHQDEGSVSFDEGQVSNAQVQVNYCFIRAPINGRAGLRLIDPGNIVHAANTNALVVIAQAQPISVIFYLQEDELPRVLRQLRAGRTMTVEAWNRDLTEKLATGTVWTMGNQIDTATGSVGVRALFTNEDFSLFPNQFVNAKLIVDTVRGATLVPTFAIQRNPQGAFVYVGTNLTVVTNETVTTNQTVMTNQIVVTNLTVTMRPVSIGITDEDAGTTSVEGLEPGEIIATGNFSKLGEGMKVTLRQAGESGEKRGAAGGKQPREKKDKPQDNAS